MATATPTQPTAAERRRLANDARRAANAVATDATQKRADAERAALGENPLAKLEAEEALPRLRVAEMQAHTAARDADAAFAGTERAWRDEAFAARRPAVVKQIGVVVEQVEILEREIAALHGIVEAGVADGVPASMWPLDAAAFPVAFGPAPMSIFGTAVTQSYIKTCVQRLVKGGWLS